MESAALGDAIELRVEGLDPAPPGAYYQGWVKGARSTRDHRHTFHLREGSERVELWSGVEIDSYPTPTVTLQEEGAGAESSGRVVLTADLAER